MFNITDMSLDINEKLVFVLASITEIYRSLQERTDMTDTALLTLDV